MIDRINMMVEVMDDDSYGFIPTYAHFDDAGMDLYTPRDFELGAGETKVIWLGIKIAVPAGYVGLVHPRSGLASNGITVMNSPGTIDSGYRGEMGVILHNGNKDGYATFHRGDRIAQMVLQRYTKADLIQVDHLPDTLRGEAGLGSTGL